MIATTFHGEDVFLLHYRANFDGAMPWKPSLLVDVQESLGGIQARTPKSATLRTSLKFSLLLFEREVAEFTNALRTMAQYKRRALVPFWPGLHYYYSGGIAYISDDGQDFVSSPGDVPYVSSGDDPAYFTTGIWFTFELDYSHYEIHETDSPSSFDPSESALRVPLMLGIFAKEPEPSACRPGCLSSEVEFQETSDAVNALTPIDATFEDGPTVALKTPKCFPRPAEWSQYPLAGQAHVNIDRGNVGFGRQPLDVYYPQGAARLYQYRFSEVDMASIASLARFFLYCSGPRRAFWLPCVLTKCKLVSPTSAGSTTVAVNDASLIGPDRYIIFTAPGINVRRRIVAVDTGANTFVVDSPPGDFAIGQVTINSLVLARFRKTDIEIEFSGKGRATAAIGFTELPPEYFTQSGEIDGTTMGELPTEAFLYRFSQIFPETTIVQRYTSFERTIVAAGEVFTPQKISHADIPDSLTPDQSTVKVSSELFEGNPLKLFQPFRLQVPLWCDILRATPDDSGSAGTPELLFTGTVGKPAIKGPKGDFVITHRLKSLDTNIPRAVIAPRCAKVQYGTYCGLSSGDWTFSARVVSVTGTTVVLDTLSRSLGLPAVDANYFAYGRIFSSPGTEYLSRTIFSSTALSGSSVTLVLGKAFDVAPVPGTIVSLRPNCVGLRDKCIGFGNGVKWGGFNFVPVGNISLTPVKKPTGSGKK